MTNKSTFKWTKGGNPTHTQHFLHLEAGYYVVSRPTSRSGYTRRGGGSGADWEVHYMNRYGQTCKRVGLIPGLKRAKAYAERLAGDASLF